MSTITGLKTTLGLLNSVTTDQTSSVARVGVGRRTIQASIAGTGAVSATVTWYGSNTNDAASGILFATSTLSGTTTDTTGNGDPLEEWPYVYCILSGISGAGAAVTTSVAV